MVRSEGDESRHDDAAAGDIVDAVNANTVVELAQLRLEVQELRGLIGTVLGLEAMTQVLENGFGSLTDELRRLVPTNTAEEIERPVALGIKELRDSLRGPSLEGIKRLDISFEDPRGDRKGEAAS